VYENDVYGAHISACKNCFYVYDMSGYNIMVISFAKSA